TALSAVPTSLSFWKAPVDKVPVLRVQHQVPNCFEIPLVRSIEMPESPQELPHENLKLSVHLQVISPLTCLQSPLY
nr:hypothetical protein [Tanacetum cinerariifolium]